MNAPIQPVETRINDLSKQVAECAQRLAQARLQHRAASVGLDECMKQFVAVSEMLLNAIHEHREGHSVAGISATPTSPEGAPYQP